MTRSHSREVTPSGWSITSRRRSAPARSHREQLDLRLGGREALLDVGVKFCDVHLRLRPVEKEVGCEAHLQARPGRAAYD